MLVVANGSFKSGSTWLFRILKLLTGFGPPPREYLNLSWRNPSIHKNALADFLRNGDYHTQNYLCKNHFGALAERALLLSHRDVLILGVDRDLRDVVVSAYYHHQRVKGYKKTFQEYYWTQGRMIADEVRKYNEVWSISSPCVYVTHYEKLLSDFEAEVSKIAGRIGIELTQDAFLKLQQDTSFANVKERSKSGHFRKGIVGDWRNHMDARMLQDIEEIQAHGLVSRQAEQQKASMLAEVQSKSMLRKLKGWLKPRFDFAYMLYRRLADFYLRWPGILAAMIIGVDLMAARELQSLGWTLLILKNMLLLVLIGHVATRSQQTAELARHTANQALLGVKTGNRTNKALAEASTEQEAVKTVNVA